MSEEKPVKIEEKKPERILNNSKRPVLLDDDFESLTENKKQEDSIINRLIKQNTTFE